MIVIQPCFTEPTRTVKNHISIGRGMEVYLSVYKESFATVSYLVNQLIE